jgi:hypothetical protein
MSFEKGHDFAIPLIGCHNIMQLRSKNSKHLEISIQGLPFNHTENIFTKQNKKTKQQIQINPYHVIIGIFSFLAFNPLMRPPSSLLDPRGSNYAKERK